ncbi:MAG: hypothetical protein JSV99_05735, partial [Planctomycetota bacterium]
ILAASNSDGEDTFWTQMLVLVILAALFGIGSLVKTRSNKLKVAKQDYAVGGRRAHSWRRWPNKALAALKEKSVGIPLKTSQPKAVLQERTFEFDATGATSHERSKIPSTKERDLHSGMEMLELDFLVGIVEKTASDDNNDVTMRKLSFNELLRREQLKGTSSKMLKDYALNKDNIYGKDIQCEAIKELAKRTGTKTRPAAQAKDLVAV